MTLAPPAFSKFTNDANLYSSQLTLKVSEEQEALSLVQLYNALGGGW
jgi:outer membrane protein, multidrug efflux system